MFGPASSHRPVFVRPVVPRRVQQHALPYYRNYDSRHWRLWTALIVFFLVLGIGWLLLVSPVLAVREVQIDGLQRVSNDEVSKAVEAKLNERWLGIFSRRAMVLVPGRAIISSLSAMPAVRSVAVSRRLPGHLAISITERIASVQWESSGQRYEVDLEGRVIRPLDPTNQADLASSLPRIVDETNATATIGMLITSPALVQLAIEAAPGPQSRGSDFASLGPSSNELYIHVGNMKVLVTTNELLDEQYRSARSVLASIPRQDISRLDTIDVRLPALATYKLR